MAHADLSNADLVAIGETLKQLRSEYGAKSSRTASFAKAQALLDGLRDVLVEIRPSLPAGLTQWGPGFAIQVLEDETPYVFFGFELSGPSHSPAFGVGFNFLMSESRPISFESSVFDYDKGEYLGRLIERPLSAVIRNRQLDWAKVMDVAREGIPNAKRYLKQRRTSRRASAR